MARKKPQPGGLRCGLGEIHTDLGSKNPEEKCERILMAKMTKQSNTSIFLPYRLLISAVNVTIARQTTLGAFG